MRLTVLRLLVVAVSIAGCARTAPQAGPRIPYDDDGVCPFSCCTYREWTVDWDTDLRSDRRDDAPAAVHVALGQTVQALTGVVTTTKVGRATASRQITIGATHLVVPAGETIYLLRNVGGGDWKIWFNGVVDQQYIPNQACSGQQQTSDECAIQISVQPETVWWAKVQGPQGREGWTREIDHFGNIDSCG